MYYASTANLDFIVGNDGSRKYIRQEDLIQLICIFKDITLNLLWRNLGEKNMAETPSRFI